MDVYLGYSVYIHETLCARGGKYTVRSWPLFTVGKSSFMMYKLDVSRENDNNVYSVGLCFVNGFPQC